MTSEEAATLSQILGVDCGYLLRAEYRAACQARLEDWKLLSWVE